MHIYVAKITSNKFIWYGIHFRLNLQFWNQFNVYQNKYKKKKNNDPMYKSNLATEKRNQEETKKYS